MEAKQQVMLIAQHLTEAMQEAERVVAEQQGEDQRLQKSPIDVEKSIADCSDRLEKLEKVKGHE